MLKIVIAPGELWDEAESSFILIEKEQIIILEHSLVSLSKWESKWKKPFLDKTDKTYEEIIDYIKCMTITQNVDSNSYFLLNESHITEIRNYIEDSMTATVFSDESQKGRGQGVVTSEVIYSWMVALNIPLECQKWHLNRLITLIRVCDAQNKPGKKMSRKEIMSRNASLNEARRKALNTTG